MLNFLYKFGIEKLLSKEIVKLALMAVIKEVFSYDDKVIAIIARKLNILADKLQIKLISDVKNM